MWPDGTEPGREGADQNLATWRPKRGPLSRVIVWVILVGFALCVLGMIAALLNMALGG